MNFTLDPYQLDFVGNIRRSVNINRHVIACATTGAGKTKCMIYISKAAIEKKKTVLILTESIPIFDQISNELECALINAKSKDIYIPKGHIYIAMAQTLKNRKALLEQLIKLDDELIVITDECHIGTFNALLEQLTRAYIIGFTATPDARWAKHLPRFYKGIVVGPQADELIQLGFLCPCKHFARIGADLNMLDLQNGEFTEASQERAFGGTKVYEGLVEDLRTLPYKKCLIFTASINDCERVFKQLSLAGFKCAIAHRGNKEHPMTDVQYTYNVGQFKFSNDTNICISVGTLTKGFDFSAIDLIVLRRATTSLPLFLQMIGRGSRRRGEQLWKKYFTVLDYGANYLRHGLWDMERDWQNLWNKPKLSKEGVAAIKLCPQCEYITNVSASICPNCGYEYLKKDIPLEVGVLIEITERYSRMRGKRASQLTPEELSIYARLKDKKSFAARIAKARDQTCPGWLDRFAEFMGYKPTWPDFARRSIPKGEKIEYPDFQIL